MRVRALRHLALALFLLLVALAVPSPQAARALPAPAGAQVGRPAQAKASPSPGKSALCGVVGPVLGGALPVIGGAAGVDEGLCETAGGLAGKAVAAAGSSVMNAVATWMIGAATQVTTFIADAMSTTTTPQLGSAWFAAQLAPMADLGAALALLVTLVALACAAVRRSPELLAATIAGMVRAGIGTALVVPLTVIGLEIADAVSSSVVSGSPHAFWASVAKAWSTGGFGGFGSSALATLIALVEVFGALFVWLELIVRNAAIYLAALFFSAVLAASIWPALNAWTSRLARLLLLFVILKPVTLTVLAFAGNAAAAGLSLGGGVPQSVGTILAAVVIFALAAFAPWTLMYLLAADAESAYAAAGLRTAAGSAVAGVGGRSLRTMGGLRNLGALRRGRAGSRGSGSSGGTGGSDGGPSGGGSAGGGSSGGGGGRGRGGPTGNWHDGRTGGQGGERNEAGGGAHSRTMGSTTTGVGGEEPEWTAQAATAMVGAGSIGAAAGYTPHSSAEHDGATSGRLRGLRLSGAGLAGASPTARSSTPPAGSSSRLPNGVRDDARTRRADTTPAPAGQGWRRDLPRRSRPSSDPPPSAPTGHPAAPASAGQARPSRPAGGARRSRGPSHLSLVSSEPNERDQCEEREGEE
jgi:type IV secretion system protein TrbL